MEAGGYQGGAVAAGGQPRCGRDKVCDVFFPFTPTHCRCSCKYPDKSHTEQKLLVEKNNKWWGLHHQWHWCDLRENEAAQSDVICPFPFALHCQEGLCHGKQGAFSA